MLTILKAIAAILTGVAITLIAILAMTPAAAPAPAVSVSEDEAGFNCATMGNETCGDNLTTIVMPNGDKGWILPAANDGRVYISWENGNVTPASNRQVEIAWLGCVNTATGGDASLAECDAAYGAHDARTIAP
jgi:hypothetical protein